jgi:cell division initiation protein
MALTPIEIESRRFGRSLSGYNRAEVDAFLQQVADALSQAVFERDELGRQTAQLMGRVEQVQRQERTLIEALAAGERLTEDRRNMAQQEAERIVADARRHAEQIISHTRAECTRVEGQLLRLKVEREAFENRLSALLDEHKRLLEIRRQEAGLADKLRTRSSVPPALGEADPLVER